MFGKRVEYVSLGLGGIRVLYTQQTVKISESSAINLIPRNTLYVGNIALFFVNFLNIVVFL